MKLRSILFSMAAVAMAAVSCDVPTESVITGTFGEDAPEQVSITLQELVDTTVAVENGKFSVTVPITMSRPVKISYGRMMTAVIPDCDAVEVDFSAEDLKVIPSNPKSLNVKLREIIEHNREFIKVNSGKIREMSMAGEPEEKINAFVDSVNVDLVNYNKEILDNNKNNYLGALVLSYAVGESTPEEVLEVIGTLTETMQAEESVAEYRKYQETKLNTAEGKMFTDFTVNTVVGMTRSIPPQPKYAEVKFSDYVGKGNYVLVDFWSPWCGPCKREIPNIKKVYEQYRDKGLEVLSIAVWEREPVQVTIDTAAELGMDWLHINNAGSVPTEIYGIEGIPHLMLIGPDGTILKRGFHGLEGIEAAVAEYIK